MCSLLVAALLVSSGISGLEARRLATLYPPCPLTGKPPEKITWDSRCVDAFEYTCCEQCQDIKQALALVSANFSRVAQWAGPEPSQLKAMNDWVNGSDANMCTLLEVKNPFDSFETSSACAKYLEQLACAMSCNPLSGSYVTPAPEGGFYLDVCKPTFFAIMDACDAVPNPDYKGLFPQYLGGKTNLTVYLKNLGTVMWGLTGLPVFHVQKSELTGPEDVGPSCWAAPRPEDVPNSACCDPLTVSGECSQKLAQVLKNRPYFQKFANDQNASLSCRVGKFWQGKKVTSFSPPPGAKTSSGNSSSPPTSQGANAPTSSPDSTPPPSGNANNQGTSGNLALPTDQPPPPKGSDLRSTQSMRLLFLCLGILSLML